MGLIGCPFAAMCVCRLLLQVIDFQDDKKSSSFGASTEGGGVGDGGEAQEATPEGGRLVRLARRAIDTGSIEAPDLAIPATASTAASKAVTSTAAASSNAAAASSSPASSPPLGRPKLESLPGSTADGAARLESVPSGAEVSSPAQGALGGALGGAGSGGGGGAGEEKRGEGQPKADFPRQPSVRVVRATLLEAHRAGWASFLGRDFKRAAFYFDLVDKFQVSKKGQKAARGANPANPPK